MEKGLDEKISCLDGVLKGDKYAGAPGAPGEESVGTLAKEKGETFGEGCFGNVGRAGYVCCGETRPRSSSGSARMLRCFLWLGGLART